MAHADYHCCACCDVKMSYSDDPTTKEMICPSCAIALFVLTGVPITTGEELARWVRSHQANEVRDVLSKAGFRRCYYGNGVDDAVISLLGKDAFDKERWLLP